MQSLAATPRNPNREPPDPRAAWVRAHQGAIWRYLRFLGCSRDHAEDLLQEALLAGLEHGVDQRPAGQARAWLRTTARNLLIDRSRAARRQPERTGLDAADAIWQEQEESRRREALRTCLSTLDGRSRRALDLRYAQNLGWSEIGHSLGMRDQGAKSLLQRIRRALRDCIERRCADEE